MYVNGRRNVRPPLLFFLFLHFPRLHLVYSHGYDLGQYPAQLFLSDLYGPSLAILKAVSFGCVLCTRPYWLCGDKNDV
ncbi:hypothetical protein H4582DRAFT_1954334, partial [Lactarius indigo]